MLDNADMASLDELEEYLVTGKLEDFQTFDTSDYFLPDWDPIGDTSI